MKILAYQITKIDNENGDSYSFIWEDSAELTHVVHVKETRGFGLYLRMFNAVPIDKDSSIHQWHMDYTLRKPANRIQLVG